MIQLRHEHIDIAFFLGDAEVIFVVFMERRECSHGRNQVTSSGQQILKLVVPRDEGSYRQVNAILYYSDVTAEMGPTCVVSKKKTEDVPLWPPFRARSIYR